MSTSSQTGTSTCSATGTGSPSSSTTGTRSKSGTPSRSPTGASSSSAAGTGSRTGTATTTPTATPPVCRAPVSRVLPLAGLAGATPGAYSVEAAGNPGMYSSGSCAAGFKTFFSGPRLVFYLDLGEGVPLGGALTLSTCGLTANNTVLYAGSGCPTWAYPFACAAGNDDAADVPGQACAGNPRASTLVLQPVGGRAHFVQVGAYGVGAGAGGGGGLVSGLSWAYVPPSQTPSRSGSRSRTRSRTRSRSASPPPPRSASATPSRTKKRK